MLNYVWIALILIGIFVAAGRDVYDEVQNTYRNDLPISAVVEVQKNLTGLRKSFQGEIILPVSEFNQFYGFTSAQSQQSNHTEIRQTVIITQTQSGALEFEMPISDVTPALWKEMSKSASEKDKLKGKVLSLQDSTETVKKISFTTERISFVKMKAVTKSAIDYADVAVTISLGLIGVMALWLGIMKVAEAAGLLAVLTRILTPVTKRLFPDVPSDHPAISAMIMNIAANMLGLNNAATPLGLKAMEELNKINPKAGTATNAMCTFLVINTSGLTLIPATAIAIRAGLGSADPGIIIGTSMFGAGCATTAGLLAVKFLQRLPRFKKEMEIDHD